MHHSQKSSKKTPSKPTTTTTTTTTRATDRKQKKEQNKRAIHTKSSKALLHRASLPQQLHQLQPNPFNSKLTTQSQIKAISTLNFTTLSSQTKTGAPYPLTITTAATTTTTTTPFRTTKNKFSSNAVDQSIPNGCSDPKVTQLFEALNKGLKPMLSNNPYTITTEGDVYELDLGNDMGVYHFERDPNEQFTLKTHRHATTPVVYMSSPVSGTLHKYYFDTKRLEQWVSVDDEHYMVELLTRELLKSCYGYPDF